MRVFTEEQLVRIFEEWKRRHDANPADFSDETYPENYGETVVRSIKSISDDLCLSIMDSGNNVVVFTLGKLTDNPSTTILPNSEAIKKLREMIEENTNLDEITLTWGPDLTVTKLSKD